MTNPAAPAHTFHPYSAVCSRCGKTLLYVEDTGAGCVSDEAIIAGRVFARLRRERGAYLRGPAGTT